VSHTAPTPPERSLLQYLGAVLSGVLLILVLALALVVIVVPKLSGGTALTVLTQSMEPDFPPGTLIVIRPTPVADIRIGQVLTYQIESGKPAVVSHRVINRTIGSDGSTTFSTRGDNNDVADPEPVQVAQVRGTLWYAVPWLGWVNNAVNENGRALVVPILVTALFLYAAWMVFGSIRDRRRRRHELLAPPQDPGDDR
jgi:signal peptidase